MPGLVCQKKGEETLAGRPVVVWEIRMEHQGQVFKGTQWIDKERGPTFALRQELSSGQNMVRFPEGQETLADRQTEKWRIETTGPDGQSVTTREWYDPELERTIRQERPDGQVNLLANIRLGEQPDQLFGVPAGYERMTAPQGGSMPPPRP